MKAHHRMQWSINLVFLFCHILLFQFQLKEMDWIVPPNVVVNELGVLRPYHRNNRVSRNQNEANSIILLQGFSAASLIRTSPDLIKFISEWFSTIMHDHLLLFLASFFHLVLWMLYIYKYIEHWCYLPPYRANWVKVEGIMYKIPCSVVLGWRVITQCLATSRGFTFAVTVLVFMWESPKQSASMNIIMRMYVVKATDAFKTVTVHTLVNTWSLHCWKLNIGGQHKQIVCKHHVPGAVWYFMPILPFMFICVKSKKPAPVCMWDQCFIQKFEQGGAKWYM